ncbi:MAG: alpha/beta fold hydrolase [Bifidobacteriaceae bacterium]|nr:alpha/beta fold hydrolase [Bifidobacteriaceae bacterium]
MSITDLRWETTPGTEMSGLLFVPDSVTAETPAPAVVVSHGMYNNREMQDINFVELSRRGFVVLSMDMYSHGFSAKASDVATILSGMYQAVKMLAGLDIVDDSRIGITGHSLGGMSSNAAVVADNAADSGLISAVLLNSADATYTDAESGEWINLYGDRSVGIVAPQYDEFFFHDVDAAGATTSPRDFIANKNAQSFLHFGTAPGGDIRQAGTLYRQDVDGSEAIRVIYTPAITHPWSHFSKRSTTATIEFFSEALGAPDPINPNNQVWQWKEAFNFVGLIGFAMFITCFAMLMLRVPFFSSLRAGQTVAIRTSDKPGKYWFWGTLVLGAIFAALVYLPLLTNVHAHTGSRDPWLQSSPAGVSIWAAACGVFTLLVLAAFYFLYMRKRGITLAERGITMPWRQVGKTVALAGIVVAVSYLCVFVVDYFFKTDFRLWVLAVKAFPPGVIWVSIFPVMIFLLVFYIVASIAANSINFIKLTGKSGEREWVNTAVLAGFNMLPAVVLVLIQYIVFFVSGEMAWADGNMVVIWLIPLMVILPVSTVISRKIYRLTNNPYLPGIINAVIITLIACSNTLTWI